MPLVEPPEVLVNIFDEFPLVVSNDKKYIATNTFLGGYLKVDTDINLVLSGWYSLITKLYQELEIHSLGGGMFIFIPSEIKKIKIPKTKNINLGYLKNLNKNLIKGDLNKVFEDSNELVLKKLLNLNKSEINNIYDYISILESWRIPK